MKSTGVVRKIDDLGRIVIPKEVRSKLEIEIKDPVEIFIDGQKVILQKYQAAKACMLTGEVRDDNISLFDGKFNLSPDAARMLVQEIENRIS